MSAAAQAVEKAVRDSSIRKPAGGKSSNVPPVVKKASAAKTATTGLKAEPGQQMTINSPLARKIIRRGIVLLSDTVSLTEEEAREVARLLARIDARERA